MLLVLIVQMIFRHKLSPAWRYGLWLMVVVRLLMPASPQTAFSIFNVVKLPRSPRPCGSAAVARTSPANPVLPVAGLVAGTAKGNSARVTVLDWSPGRAPRVVARLVLTLATRLLWSNLRFWLRIAASQPSRMNQPGGN